MIFAKYVKDIAAVTKTNGVGVFMHKKKAPDPKDKTVVLNKDLNLVSLVCPS